MSISNEQRSKWNLKMLHEHLRQAAMFGDLPEEEIRALAEDMARNGQRQPVEIRPDGTIIAGHQRVLAAKLLGWTEIDVIVRYDLEEQGDAAVEAYFVGDNLFRRQLSPLATSRLRPSAPVACSVISWTSRFRLF
jgi:ParB-like chromosome segregation protein Spo0J